MPLALKPIGTTSAALPTASQYEGDGPLAPEVVDDDDPSPGVP